MCGIAGIIQTSPGPYTREDLHRMTDCLSHRGPDTTAYWQNKRSNALLGHDRLSIIDLTAAASQPMHLLDRYTIIHNGEIYNYIELRSELQKLGHSFRTHSDTEVILVAYHEYKEDCVEKFDGMFSFAIWDEEEQELFAARDRMGEKPFYYSFTGAEFIFGSEIKALFAAGIERKPNLLLHFNFITIGYTDNPGRPEETFFENIFKLPPGSRLYYSPIDNELEIEKYWDIDLSKKMERQSDENIIGSFNELYHRSVRRRLRSDVALGTSLSGGLDSSSIVAVASRYRTTPMHAFTAVFPGFEKDETVFAKLVADKYNLVHTPVTVTVDDLLKDWDRFMMHMEEPIGSASAYAQYKVFDAAKQHHITVLLDGQGADETLAGYSKYYKWYWQELFQRRKLFRSGELKAAKALGVTESFGFRNIIAALFPDIASVLLEKQYLARALAHPELSKEFVRLQSSEAYYTTPVDFTLNGALYFNTSMHGLEELLKYADRNSMAHGREVRLPFLQHELVEFLFSLPSDLKIRQGWTKWLLRKAMEKELPGEIVWRKNKVGFEPPQKQWMQDSRIQDMVHEARKKLIGCGILNAKVQDRPIHATAAHDADNFDWRYLAAAPFL